MTKKIFLLSGKVLLIFLIGAFGGIWGNYYLLPKIILYSPLNQIKWLNSFHLGSSTTIINQTKKEFITQNQAIGEIINNISPSIVGIRTIDYSNNKPVIKTEGSGLIFTNDGIILTASNLLPKNKNRLKIEVFLDQKWIPANINNISSDSDIITIKVNTGNSLPITDWNESSNFIVGQQCILIGFNHKNKRKIVDLGFIKSYPPIELSFSIEPGFMTGGAVFDLSGKIIGIINVQANHAIKFISTSNLLKLINSHKNERR